MIKNKDGSYNKFSILIISLIIIIGVSIVGSLLVTESPTIDVMSLAYIGLVVSGGLTIYYGKKVFFKSNSNVIQTPTVPKMKVVETNQKQFTVEDEPTKVERPVKRSHEPSTRSGVSLNITTMIITLVTGAVVLIIGTTVANSMLQALPELPSNSPMSTSLTSVTENISTAFNFAALGLFVIAAVGIIMMVSNVMSRD